MKPKPSKNSQPINQYILFYLGWTHDYRGKYMERDYETVQNCQQ